MRANSIPGLLVLPARAPRGEMRLEATGTRPGVAATLSIAERSAAAAAPLLASIAGLTVLPTLFARGFGLI